MESDLARDFGLPDGGDLMGNKRVAALAWFSLALATVYFLHVPQESGVQKNVNPTTQVTNAARRTGVRITPEFNVFNFIGMGDIALLFNSHGPDGGSLYTILNRSGQSDVASFHFIADHVLWAKFSPNGSWLALERIEPGATGLQRTLWLISSNGEQRQQVATGAQVPAGTWMPKGSTYLYGIHHLYSLRPLGSPRYLPFRFSGNVTIRSIEFSPHGRTAALLIRENASGTSGSYDEIGLWRRGARAVRPLVVVAPPNGLVLGPFSADGKSLFYWPVLVHAPGSASVAQSMLSVVTLSGQGATVVTTPIEPGAIQPFGQNRALVLVAGNSPSTRVNLRLAIWYKGNMSMLPGNANAVELWPAVNPQATQIAFVTAANPGWSTGGLQAVRSLKGQLQLAAYNLGSTRIHIIAAAGNGVSMPVYDATGRRIVYTQNGKVMWIVADGKGVPYFVAGPALSQGSPQTAPNEQQPVVIADYLPAPDVNGQGNNHARNFQ